LFILYLHLDMKLENETDDTKDYGEKELYDKIQIIYYKLIGFKKILDACKLQLQTNQYLINCLIVNLPRMKEYVGKHKGRNF
jgi:hypothetical protein